MPFNIEYTLGGYLELNWIYDPTDYNTTNGLLSALSRDAIKTNYNFHKEPPIHKTFQDISISDIQSIVISCPNNDHVNEINIDIRIFSNIIFVYLHDITLYTIQLPENVGLLNIHGSRIHTLHLPPIIKILYIDNSPGVYNAIVNIPDSLFSISVGNDCITDFKIPPKAVNIHIFDCTLEKISNEHIHLEHETHLAEMGKEECLTFIVSNVTSPYNLALVNKFITQEGELFTLVHNTYTVLEKLQIIYKTNLLGTGVII